MKVLIISLCFVLFYLTNLNAQTEILQIEGAITIQDVSDSNIVAAGTIRWTGTDFEGYNGTDWYSLTGKTSAAKMIGDLHEGGIVFQTYDRGEHGMIASLIDLDQGAGIEWSPASNRYKLTNADNFHNGEVNTEEIIDSIGIGDYAAMRCDTFSAGGYIDWYLPSRRELDLLMSQDILVNMSLSDNGYSEDHYIKVTPYIGSFGAIYWSSTEHSSSEAHHSRLDVGFFYSTSGYKDEKARVRCIRRF